ncbi:alpha/beta hydrolase [Methylobacter sp. BBA5.1]|uniref:alpha/beta hydrolase n=1 Tax=Methylobacter sp. BBA5.1 TaxID=1495064 RepID=UPI00068E7024|nr:alpha/beta hydrolase [Methylobacter sp. BBA5.1]
MILKYFYRWSSVLLLIPGIVLANQGGNRESPANDWKTCYQESGLPFLCGSKPPAIDWQACYRESGLPFLCGSVDVPLDYNAPEGGKLNLALIKLPAAMGERSRPVRKIGSLFLNPGGPGISGVDFVLGAGQVLPLELRERFDIIGFDPRGTARSNPLVCFNGPVTAPPFFFPRTPAEEALTAKFDLRLATKCKANGGSVFDHMSTANVARDLDVLRQAVGDSRLNYVGYSYGSFLGITYANLFPNRIRTMVLDGIVDPIAYTTGDGDEGYTLPVTTRLRRAEGSQATLNEFFRLCDQAGLGQCPFGNMAASKFDFLVDHLRAAPVHIIDPITGPYDLTYDRFIATVFGALVNSLEWPLLSVTLNEIHAAISDGSEDTAKRAGEALAVLAATIGDPADPEDPTQTLAAQQFSVLCTDSINPDNHEAWSLAGAAADENVGVFGRITTWQSSPCAVWRSNDPDRYLGPFSRVTSKPILIVANLFDPLTPYEGAQQVHGLLPNSALLTLEGWGHTSLFLSSCVDQTVFSYLLTSRVSRTETSCQQDVTPFADTLAEPMIAADETSPEANRANARRRTMQKIGGPVLLGPENRQ